MHISSTNSSIEHLTWPHLQKEGIEASIIKGKRKMKGAENTELCSLGGLSLKTHEIIRTAKQHFWETISQIVKKINAERVRRRLRTPTPFKNPKNSCWVLGWVFFFFFSPLLWKEKCYTENKIINYILNTSLWVYKILDRVFSLDFGVGKEFIHINKHRIMDTMGLG